MAFFILPLLSARDLDIGPEGNVLGDIRIIIAQLAIPQFN
jgi:hypothetical protein